MTTATDARCWRSIPRRRGPVCLATLTSVVLAGTGCGAQSGTGKTSPTPASEAPPAYVTAPPTHEQQLVEQGAQLVIVDGCSACHLQARRERLAPDFASFAGHRVTLTNGQRLLVDEHFLITALSQPGKYSIRGYDPHPMIHAITSLALSSKPQQVAALAAFIEQSGPEAG